MPRKDYGRHTVLFRTSFGPTPQCLSVVTARCYITETYLSGPKRKLIARHLKQCHQCRRFLRISKATMEVIARRKKKPPV